MFLLDRLVVDKQIYHRKFKRNMVHKTDTMTSCVKYTAFFDMILYDPKVTPHPSHNPLMQVHESHHYLIINHQKAHQIQILRDHLLPPARLSPPHSRTPIMPHLRVHPWCEKSYTTATMRMSELIQNTRHYKNASMTHWKVLVREIACTPIHHMNQILVYQQTYSLRLINIALKTFYSLEFPQSEQKSEVIMGAHNE